MAVQSTLEKNTSQDFLRDPMVLQAIQLAERLRQAKGDELEGDEYRAIEEATGVSQEYLKFVETQALTSKNRNFVDTLRSQYIALESDTRRYVTSAAIGTFASLFWSLGTKIDALTTVINSRYGLFQTLSYLLIAGAIYNAANSKNSKAAASSGAIVAGAAFVMGNLFNMLLLVRGVDVDPFVVLPSIAGGAIVGYLTHSIVSRSKNKTPKDQAARQVLLQQLVELQDQLRERQQSITFLSLDVVGSTKMKLNSDPLAVEFTFNEYHKFIEKIVEKHFGSIHSTAGDGITAAFDNPQHAFNAAKQIQTGLIELNTLRNQLGVPLTLRAGIHTGLVVAPKAGDVTSINFASVIDIAAHLQKECPVGGIAISDHTAQSISGGIGAIGTERITVHETAATIWQRKKSLDSFRPEVN